MRTFLFLLGQLTQYYLLGDEIDFFVGGRLPELYEESGSKVTSANALDFFEFLLVAYRETILILFVNHFLHDFYWYNNVFFKLNN